MLNNFSNVKVLVIGDIMLDLYWWGTVTRISPEAPVPVVDLEKSTYAAGGAANVAANIAGLGAGVYLVGCVGTDAEARELETILEGIGISTKYLVHSTDRPTSIKTRVIAHGQQVVRVDRETTTALTPEDELNALVTISSIVADVDVLIVSDYAKGFLSERLLSEIIDAAHQHGKPVFVDPKGKDYSRYRGAALLTPNRREAAEACNLEMKTPDLVNLCGDRLLNDLDLDMVLITESEDGMTLFEKGKGPIKLSAAAKEIYDVTGAGDTVIACLGVALAAGMDLPAAAHLANAAAGAVVEQVGTTFITREMLEPRIDRS